MTSEDPTLSKILDENLSTEKRQALIESIESRLSEELGEEARVITHLSQDSMIADDVKAFEDMLQSVDFPENLFLFINSPGGDPETALRIINMCRGRADHFRTIIPDMAKSAATQVCLGSEEIWMGYNSELGPIDPQIPFNGEYTAAYTIKEGLEFIEQRAANKGNVPTQIYSAIAQHYTPAKLREAHKSIEYVKESATEMAGDMFDTEEEARECVEELLSEQIHSKAIDISAAQSKGLKVQDMRSMEELWDDIWELYIRSDVVMNENDRGKLWETKDHTITIGQGEEN